MAYYEYRSLSPEQRTALVQERLARGYPPHSPPHPVRDQPFYLLTATCFQHTRHISAERRRQQLLDLLFEAFISRAIEITAWAVLPNHYHLLVHVEGFRPLADGLRYVHHTMAHEWNTEDGALGRQVWYRYTDRAIRSERHYYTTLNYIHYNPVKHGWVSSPYDWAHSSVHWYLEHHGRAWLRDLWVRYPLRSYGAKWDGEPDR